MTAPDPYRCICDPDVLFEPPDPRPVAVEGCTAHQARRAVQLLVARLNADMAAHAHDVAPSPCVRPAMALPPD